MQRKEGPLIIASYFHGINCKLWLSIEGKGVLGRLQISQKVFSRLM